MKVYIDEIKKRNNDLINYEGYIPLYFNFFINLPLRHKILYNKNIFDKVFNETLKHRQELNLASNKKEYFYKDIKEWIKKNKGYENILL